MEGFVNTLLSVEADSVCGAGYGEVSSERVNRRNGYRHRDLDTRIGTLDVAVPKLREGSYFPEWLLQRRRRAEALTSVVVRSRPAKCRSRGATRAAGADEVGGASETTDSFSGIRSASSDFGQRPRTTRVASHAC